jgi:XisH protein
MPQRDVFHATVRTALERDGWTITADPLVLLVGQHNLFVDLGAERLLAAEKRNERIAVEVKSFVGRSAVADLELALGQYILYRGLLRRNDPERALFLAIPEVVYDTLLSSELGQVARAELGLALMVFNPVQEVVGRWLR